jgi:hypothetical protein
VYYLSTAGNDEAQAVAVAADGSVYVTGAVNHSPSTMSSQLWVARLDDPNERGDTPMEILSATWEHVYPMTGGHHRGLDVAMDHLDRPVFTGHFGFEAMQDYPINCLDFDPDPVAQDIHCSNGGLDIFVMRLSPYGAYDWTYTLGGDDADDAGTKIAIEQTNSGMLVHAGYFGKRSGPPTPPYVVDFDPGSGTATAAANGEADAFVNRFSQGVEDEFPLTRLCIALPLVSGEDYANMMAALSGAIELTDDAFPSIYPTFPSGRVALSLVMYDAKGYEQVAAPVLPWTLITDETRQLVADRVYYMLRPESGSPGLSYGAVSMGTLAAGRMLHESQYTGFGSILVYATITGTAGNILPWSSSCAAGSDEDQLNLARDYVLGLDPMTTKIFKWPDTYPILDECNDLPTFPEGVADRLCVFQVAVAGVASVGRDYWLARMAESKVDVQTAVPDEDHIAFAGLHVDSPGSPLFQINPGPFGWPQVQQRILMRLTVCPGDYDRDGDVDGADADAFFIGFNSIPPELYANWNFDDNSWTSAPDEDKFNAEHANGCASP